MSFPVRPETIELPDAVLVALVVASAVTDLRSRRILNAFTYPAILAGLLLNLTRGEADFISAAAACALGFAVFLPFYRSGGMGMGDLKLMAAIGALKGLTFWAAAMVDSALAGGLIAMAVTFRRGTAGETLKRAVRVPAAMAVSLWRGKRYRIPPGKTGNVTIPYGVAIAAGTMAALILKWPW